MLFPRVHLCEQPSEPVMVWVIQDQHKQVCMTYPSVNADDIRNQREIYSNLWFSWTWSIKPAPAVSLASHSVRCSMFTTITLRHAPSKC